MTCTMVQSWPPVSMSRKKNSWFQFKQFRVEQAAVAMKVTTEACLFGALINTTGCNQILDIGTGSGLLALMLAQRSTAQVRGVELNVAAAQQASENMASSPWAGRLSVWQGNICDYSHAAGFDLIVSNPPFYSKHQLTGDLARDQAMHTQYLSFADLCLSAKALMRPAAHFYVLLPPYEAGLLRLEAAGQGLYLQGCTTIRNFEGGAAFRQVLCFGQEPQETIHDELVIYASKEARIYTAAVSDLLSPYYLYL